MKEILITSSVLIAVLLLLRVVFAKKVSRVLIYGAWALVALRLLIPVQIGQLDFSMLTAAKPVIEAVDERVEDAILGTAPEKSYEYHIQHYIEKDPSVFIPEVQEQIQQEISQGTQTREEIFEKIQQEFPEQEILTPEGQETVQMLVGIGNTTLLHNADTLVNTVWAVSIAAMAVWFTIVNLRHSRMLLKNREKLDCNSPVPVYVSEKVGSPCLVGLFRPAIYLTPECAASEETMRHVLTHELTHYRHMDHIWSVVRCICLCVYWFNPLVWVAAWFSRRDCELACDEGALKRLGPEERIAYGRSLLDVVSHASTPAHLMETATAMNETKKQLKERVNFIVKKPKISLIAAICMVLVCAIVAGCAVAGPMSGTEMFRADCETDREEYRPGDTIRITARVTNTEKAAKYTGGIERHFTQAELFIHVNGEKYTIPSKETGAITTDATEHVWEKGETVQHIYSFEIPSEAKLGVYSLSFCILGERIITNDVISIVDEDTPGSTPPASDPDSSWQTGIGAPIGFDTNTVVAKVFPEDDYGNGYPIALIINSKAGIEAHLSRLGYPEYLEIMKAAEAYDDTFFESHSLILVWNPPGSSSDAYRVNSLHRIAEDVIEIGMCKVISTEGAQDRVSKLIFVETSKKIPEKTVCNVNCPEHRGQKPPQVSLVEGEQVLKPRLRGYGWTNNCGSTHADGGFIGNDTDFEKEYPWLYTSQRSVLLESPVAPQKISVECWNVSNWGSDPFEIHPEKLKVENGSIPLKLGTYFYAVTVEWSAWYTDREFGRGEAYYGFVAHVSDESDNDQPAKPVEAVFNTKNVVRITFYAYYGGGKGSDVPAENMAEIILWLNTFAVGEKAPDLLPPGTGTWQVEIEYADGTVVKRSLDTITIDGVIYYLKSDLWPDILVEIMSMVSQ